MSLQLKKQPESPQPALLPLSVLDNLAWRIRPSGLFLMMLGPSGELAYHDPAGGLFFERYVVPMIRGEGPGRDPILEKVAALNLHSGIEVWHVLPGVLLAAFPYVEKRRLTGVVLLAGRSAGFRLDEDVLRACSRLGIDCVWLNRHGETLAGHSAESLARQARLLHSMMRDQVRVTTLEDELQAISGQLANSYEELSLIYQITGGMKVNRQTADFFRHACLNVLEVMCVNALGVVLAPKGQMVSPVVYGQNGIAQPVLERFGRDLLGLLAVRPTPLVINDLSKDETLAWMGDHARQVLSVPLQRQDEVLGCLFALDKHEGEFDSMDSKLLHSIATQSAIYLENAMLFDEVHGLMMGLLHSLTSAVDAKDPYTCGHSQRVALLSRRLALAAGLPETAADRIYMAGLLHDVGKIGVPESVLHKSGRLTPDEFDQMKKHPQIGAHILRDIVQVEDLIPGVMHHHERFDGKGYPSGLAGRDIPLMGRLICLADSFDAMTSNRTYRNAMPLEAALNEIRRCAGTQFDPALAEAFLSIPVEHFQELMASHRTGFGAAAPAGVLVNEWCTARPAPRFGQQYADQV